jgi:hypothetical protein
MELRIIVSPTAVSVITAVAVLEFVDIAVNVVVPQPLGWGVARVPKVKCGSTSWSLSPPCNGTLMENSNTSWLGAAVAVFDRVRTESFMNDIGEVIAGDRPMDSVGMSIPPLRSTDTVLV